MNWALFFGSLALGWGLGLAMFFLSLSSITSIGFECPVGADLIDDDVCVDSNGSFFPSTSKEMYKFNFITDSLLFCSFCALVVILIVSPWKKYGFFDV